MVNTVREGVLTSKRSVSGLCPLPNFLIIGAMKGGTTSLYHNMVQHPKIIPALWKEIYFFDSRYYKGLNWYRSHFSLKARPRPDRPSRITGEATPSYLYHPHAARRAHACVPEARLVVLLRNPIERAYSHYHHEVRRGGETRSFEEAIEQEEALLSGELDKIKEDEHYYSKNYMRRSYMTRGIYIDQLKTWMNYFDRERFLILRSEDFFEDPPSALKHVYSFLDLPDWQPDDLKKYGAFQYSKIAKSTREYLVGYFEPHNQRLYEFLGTDLAWK
jgi:hypothetical protein